MARAFDHKRFATWLQYEAMPAAGIDSQSELARRTGIAQATISRWVGGSRTPSYEDLADIAQALGIGRLAVYEAAGLIPTQTPQELAEAMAIWEPLTDEERQMLSDIGRVLMRRRLESQ